MIENLVNKSYPIYALCERCYGSSWKALSQYCAKNVKHPLCRIKLLLQEWDIDHLWYCTNLTPPLGTDVIPAGTEKKNLTAKKKKQNIAKFWQ